MKDHELDALLKELAEQDESTPLPESFQTGWREAVKEEAMKNTQKKPMFKNWLAMAAALVFLVGGTLMTQDHLNVTHQAPMARTMMKASGAQDNAMLMAEEASYDDTAAWGMMTSTADAGAVTESKKIIRTLDVTLRTTDFEGDTQKLKDLCASLGGWVEYAWQTGDVQQGELRRGEMTLRIPTAQLETARGQLEAIGRITALTESARDVTATYQDTQTRLKTQQTKMERLQTMLAAATEMDDLIQLESAIADTQYTIDSYESQLKNTDRQVDYTAVNVTLREEAPAQTAQEKAVPLWQRIGAGLEASLVSMGEFFQAMAVFVVAAAPWLLILLVLWLALKLIRKGRRKNQ